MSRTLSVASRLSRVGWGGLLSLLLAAPAAAVLAQETALTELTAEEQRQVQIAERFLTVLERSPRRGTALDRVYGHHVEFGTLDQFIESLRTRAQSDETDGAAWMLLGLIESQRGEDADAIDAFRAAERLRPDDAMAPYYLGQSLLLLGQPEEAVAAFERAIERQPPRADLLEIFQQLGRVHQRAQREEAALAVWTRLEKLFPDDPRVQEQIAVTLVEEGEYALALPRYEKLAELVTDDYRRTMFQLEAAELNVREGGKEEGIGDLEGVLGNLNPESWLYRDVRRRIEDIFLRSGDQDGLVKYYERWIETHPEDVNAMARVAKFLASSARMPEATEWMERAIKLAPSRVELRRSFIDQLVDDQRYSDAVQQYELLAAADPGNPDVLRDWGKLVLKDKSLPVEQRRAKATEIWRQIIANRPDDALTVSQVADLYRQSNQNDEAIALYQRAIELSPGDPQYREYLGEFFHILKRPEEALATWKEIAAGDRQTAVNVARLAEVYNTFGYMPAAVERIAEACELEPKDFALQLRSADYHTRAEKYDEALAYVAAAGALAANSEERDAVITQRIEVLQSSRRLEEESDALAAKLERAVDAASDDWHLLARYYEAERRWAKAVEAIGRALTIDAKSIPALTTAARIAESSGDLGRAAELNRNLAEVDRRSRGDHLMNVARLKAQLGQTQEALAAGRDLIVSAPGNTDNYEFYAQLCFQLGEMDEGLETLRKAVRINPTEPALIQALGSALSQQVRTDEAIEVYWRAFERTEEVEEKVALTEKLTDLYLQLNQFDRLIERFERDRREEDLRRDMTICLAQAHHSAGDYGTARMELESLLSQETRDTNLLQQLSKLCEGGSDLDGAIEYQRQLASIAPGHETEFRLAGLLQQAGYTDQASDIFVKLTRREEDPVRLVRSIDSLLSQGSYDSVLAIVEPLLSEQRDDWELMYRQGVAWASLDKEAEAEDVFRRIAALKTPLEAYGRAAEEKFKRELAKAKSNNLQGIRTDKPRRMSPLSMLNHAAVVRQTTGLEPDRSSYSSSRGPVRVWTPDVYGVARMAAYGWLLKSEQSRKPEKAGEAGSFVDTIASRAAADDAPREAIYDWMFVEALRGNYDSLHQVARRLARDGGREEQAYFLQSLMTRNVNAESAQRQSSGQEAAKAEPLGEEDLELMLNCFESLRASDGQSAQSTAAMFGGQIAHGANGQVYVNVGGNWVLISSSGSGDQFFGTVVKELELAGREEQVKALIEEKVASAETAAELAGSIQFLMSRATEKKEPLPEQLTNLYDRWVAAATQEINDPPQSVVVARSRSRTQVHDPLGANSQMLIAWFGRLGPEEEHEQMLSLLDPALDIAVEVAKARRVERSRMRRRTSTSRSTGQWGMSYTYGENSQYVRVNYPQPSDYASHAQLSLLRAVHEIFNRNDVAEDLPAGLQQRVDAADADTRVYEQLMLAYVLWWGDRQEEALEILTAASEQLQDDPQFRLELALVHQSQGDLDTAMDIVEAIAPRDRKLLQQREMTAMSLAERLGEVGRARQAAERLFGLRLSTEEQLGLATAMRRLGLMDLAESVLARAQRRAGNQASSWPLLMAQYQGQGKIELAQQLAHRILQTTQPPLTGMSTSARNPFRYSSSNSNSGNRQQALRVLQQTGGLTPMIERLEKQLAASPESPRLYEQLIELYEVTNQRDKLTKTLQTAVEARPDAAALQYQLAKHYEQTGKASEACDCYLEVLQLRPRWVADDLYSIRRLFERAERSLDLARAFEDVDLRQLGHPYYLIDIVSNLMSDEENIDIAAEMFERIVDAFPNYRNQMISRVRDSKVWKNDRIYALGKRLIIPTEQEVVTTPWFGINDVYSYSSNGTVNAMFHEMRDGVFEAGRLDDFRQTIEEASEEMPDWHGGKAMLALIALKENDKDKARGMLESLVSDDEVVASMPRDACWLIGQELDGHQETRPLALKLFEKGVVGEDSNNQLQYSPLVRLIKLYSDSGRKEEARDLLLKNLKPNSMSYYDQDYQQAMIVQNKFWAAERLDEMGFALDALILYQELSTSDASLERAASWNGDSVEGLKRRISTGLAEMIEEVGESDPDAAMERLLADPEDRRPGEPVFDLMLTVAPLGGDAYKEMSSRFIDLLASVAKGEALSAGVQKRLAELHAAHAADVSISVTRALLAEKEDRPQAVEQLVTQLEQNPLETVPRGRRPNARQRREALQRVPVWMVARECLQDETLREDGLRLAEQALAGAQRQIGRTQAAAILMEWGETALEVGDNAEAERRWSQLLDLATQRPTRKKKSTPDRRTGLLVPAGEGGWSSAEPVYFWDDRSVPATEAPAAETAAEVVPPLTTSQFKIAREVAIRAAENGMADLSRRAVREMLAGGTPVPDVVQQSTPTRGGFVASAPAVSSLTAQSSGQADEIEQLVSESLISIVSHWNGPAYRADEVYTLLRPVVLPPSRPTEVLLYADSSGLNEALVSDAGSVVIEWARKADRLDEFAEAVRERVEASAFDLPARVLLVKSALAQEDLKAAEAELEALAAKLTQALTESSATLACHAALPASELPELKEPAFRILRATVKLRAQAAATNRSDVSIGPLQRRVIRYLADEGQNAEVAAFFEEYLASRQGYYSRYSGDSGLYRQWRDWATLATEAVQVGAVPTALDFLGRTVDFEMDRYSRPSVRDALAGVLKETESLPAEERYRLWRDWSLPTEGRRAVRIVVEQYPLDRTPAEFRSPEVAPPKFLQSRDLHSNLYCLLDAAEECGRLEELRGLVKPAVQEQVEGAEILWPLVLIRMGDLQAATPVLNELAATMKERNERKEGQPRIDISRDYLVYHAALQSPAASRLYMKHRTKLREQLRNRGGSRFLSRLDADYARARAAEVKASIEPGDDPGLVYWAPATTDGLPSSGVKPWWAVAGRQLMHLGGTGSDSLYFRVPLTGNFEFSVDCMLHNWSEAEAGYNGVVVESQRWGSRMYVRSVGEHESFRIPQPLRRARPAFNTVTVKVRDGVMSHWLNNHQVYEEPVSGTSPWLHLTTEAERHAVFTNLKLTGAPEVPDSIDLFAGERLDGWNTSYFGESQPKHRIMEQDVTPESDYQLRRDFEREPAEHDWRLRDGVLRGRANRSATANDRGWAYYHRPLAEDEAFSYEFRYQSGKSVVHPTLGRVAYKLTPGGVATHWIGNIAWDHKLLGVKTINGHVPQEHRRGPTPLPLKAGEWNAVELTLSDGTVRVSLNGELVYEGPAVAEPDTRFGLLRLKRHDVQVRNAQLRGPWREMYDALVGADLLALRQPVDDKDMRVLSPLGVEQYRALEVPHLMELARTLEPEQAYDVLSEWVLPSPAHGNIRLYYVHSPFATTADSAANRTREPWRSLPAGQVDCPAVELIELAQRLGRLPELARIVAAASPWTDNHARSKQAMSVLIAIAAGEDDTALELLRPVEASIVKGLNATSQLQYLSPEVMAIRAAVSRPRLAVVAYQLAQRLVDEARRKDRSSGWKDETMATLGFAETTLKQGHRVDRSADGELTQWKTVPFLKPQYRSTGRRSSDWRFTRGMVEQNPAHTWGQLYFQSPLRGKFEIVAERTLHGYREVAISYGMHAAAPTYNFKAIDVTTVMQGNKRVKGCPEFPWLGTTAEFRIAVDDRTVTTFVEDRQIHELNAAKPLAPWLMVQGWTPQSRSTVRNLRIIGEPEIPDELDLLDTWNLGCWRADYYHGSLSVDGSNENATWRPAGDELLGNLVADRTAAHLETVLLYQRPLLEDGEITFETFYAPGEFEVHPAVGGAAYLLSANGVQRHELTDGEYEFRGRLPDNASSIAGAAAEVPLKENEWNAVTLTLIGSELTIRVNDAVVATLTDTVEPSERFFGLFRYGNLTKARVRNVRYRGDWPKELPPVEAQELAYPSGGALQIADSHWTTIRDLDVSSGLESVQEAGFTLAGGPTVAETTPTGLRLHIDNAPDGKHSPSLTSTMRVVGDCELSVDFEQLQLTPVKEGWGNGIVLKFHLADTGNSFAELALTRNAEGQPMIKVAHQHKRLNGEGRHDQQDDPRTIESGRLRLVRLGGTVYGLYAETGSERFTFVGSVPIGTDPITRVEVSGISSDNEAVVDFVLTDCMFKSRDVSGNLSRAGE